MPYIPIEPPYIPTSSSFSYLSFVEQHYIYILPSAWRSQTWSHTQILALVVSKNYIKTLHKVLMSRSQLMTRKRLWLWDLISDFSIHKLSKCLGRVMQIYACKDWDFVSCIWIRESYGFKHCEHFFNNFWVASI